MDYTTLELRALAHTRVWAYDNLPRPKVRQAAYHLQVDRSGVLTSRPATEWDRCPPLSQGRQRCLSSRETIERLAAGIPGLLPTEPQRVRYARWLDSMTKARQDSPAHWRDIFERDRERVSRVLNNNLEHEARLKTRTVWMGGDYIDDGTHKATPEEGTERWRWLREVIVEAGKRHPTDPEAARLLREETLYGSQTYYPPHMRDTKPRG